MSQRPSWLGNFYGGNLGFLNYEVLTIQHIARASLAEEPALMRQKWFDYRRLHPMQATYYFVRCWTQAYRNFYRKNINADAAPYVRCVKENDFLEARERLTIWKLRQLCDRMGMRYDFFMQFAMNWFWRFQSKDGKVYAPRPAHFLSNEDMIGEAMLAWEEQCATSLQVARDPYYRIANFTGAADQLAHEAYLIAQIKRRQHPRYALHACMYVFDAVRIEEALRHFDERVVRAAIGEVALPSET